MKAHLCILVSCDVSPLRVIVRFHLLNYTFIILT